MKTLLAAAALTMAASGAMAKDFTCQLEEVHLGTKVPTYTISMTVEDFTTKSFDLYPVGMGEDDGPVTMDQIRVDPTGTTFVYHGTAPYGDPRYPFQTYEADLTLSNSGDITSIKVSAEAYEFEGGPVISSANWSDCKAD